MQLILDVSKRPLVVLDYMFFVIEKCFAYTYGNSQVNVKCIRYCLVLIKSIPCFDEFRRVSNLPGLKNPYFRKFPQSMNMAKKM